MKLFRMVLDQPTMPTIPIVRPGPGGRKARHGRCVAWASLLVVTLMFWPVPGEAWTPALQVVQDRTYRVGVFLVVALTATATIG